MTPDTFTRSQWYAIGRLPDFEGAEAKPVRLLSQDLTVSDAAGVLSVNDADGRSLLIHCLDATDADASLPAGTGFGDYEHLVCTGSKSIRWNNVAGVL